MNIKRIDHLRVMPIIFVLFFTISGIFARKPLLVYANTKLPILMDIYREQKGYYPATEIGFSALKELTNYKGPLDDAIKDFNENQDKYLRLNSGETLHYERTQDKYIIYYLGEKTGCLSRRDKVVIFPHEEN